jgi:hypothetical protein
LPDLRWPFLLSLVLLYLGSVSCSRPLDPRVCTAIAVDALAVTVVDAATGQRICDATVTAVDGSFRSALRAFPAGAECSYSGPTERTGRYEVQVSRAGYEPAVLRDVRVSADECHVIPVALTVPLRRASP